MGLQNVLGSVGVRFLQAGIGSISRSLQSKLRESVSVTDFLPGGVPSGTPSVNDAAFARALALNRLVRVPYGDYFLSQPITLNPGNELLGESMYFAKLVQTNTSLPVVKAGNSTFLRGFTLYYPTQAVSGGDALLTKNVHQFGGSDLNIINAYNAINADAANTVRLRDIEATNYTGSGIRLSEAVELYLDTFTFWAGPPEYAESRGLNGGIFLDGRVEGCEFSHGDVLLGSYSLRSVSSDNSNGHRPQWLKFEAVMFDSPRLGSVLEVLNESDFDDCWFSFAGGYAALPATNLLIGGWCRNLRFTGGQSVYAGQNGVILQSGSSLISFSNFGLTGNGVSPLDGASTAGMIVEPGVSSWRFSGVCSGGDVEQFRKQEIGVYVAPGYSDHYMLDVLHDGLTVGAIVDGGTGDDKLVSAVGKLALIAPLKTGAPSISGTRQAGETLTGYVGYWAGTSPITYAYQWLRNGVAIQGATSSTYTLTSDDVGAKIGLRITAVNSVGSTDETVTDSVSVSAAGTSSSLLMNGGGSYVMQDGNPLPLDFSALPEMTSLDGTEVFPLSTGTKITTNQLAQFVATGA